MIISKTAFYISAGVKYGLLLLLVLVGLLWGITWSQNAVNYASSAAGLKDGSLHSLILTASALVIAGAIAGFFAFTYKNIRSEWNLYIGHVTTGLLLVLIGCLLLMVNACLRDYAAGADLRNVPLFLSLILFASLICYDAYNLLRLRTELTETVTVRSPEAAGVAVAPFEAKSTTAHIMIDIVPKLAIIVGIVAVIVVFTISRSDRKAEAIELYKDYVMTWAAKADIEAEKPELERWYLSYSVFTADSILNMTRYDESWKLAVEEMLEEHLDKIYSEDYGFPLSKYGRGFQAFLNGLRVETEFFRKFHETMDYDGAAKWDDVAKAVDDERLSGRSIPVEDAAKTAEKLIKRGLIKRIDAESFRITSLGRYEAKRRKYSEREAN